MQPPTKVYSRLYLYASNWNLITESMFRLQHFQNFKFKLLNVGNTFKMPISSPISPFLKRRKQITSRLTPDQCSRGQPHHPA